MYVRNIDKFYINQTTSVHALKQINIEFIKTGVVFIMGESGSGKSTLLRILAGKDTDFKGTVHFDSNPYYVSSDYDLLNELTVIENLALTRTSIRYVKTICENFKVSDLLNKKTKLLSNGEKRRIQLIKAVLMDHKTILLDETVSALDYENLMMVMDLLKAFSKDHLIIIVTHNDTLVNDYADQIIQLKDGQVINNEILHDKETLSKKYTKSKSYRKDTLRSLYAFTKELLAYKISIIILAIITVICASVSSSLFNSTNNNTVAKQAIENNNATLTAVPIAPASSERNSYAVYQRVYHQYNSFYYQDILDLIEENNAIIAVNPFYSFKYSEHLLASSDTHDYGLLKDSTKLNNNYPTFTGLIRSDPIEQIDYIISEAYYMDQEHCDTYACSKFFHFNDSDSQVIMNKVNVFNLVNDYQKVVKLLYGNFGTAPNEMVIDYSLAEKLVELYALESMEALLNHEFVLNIVRHSNVYSIERIYTMSILAYDLGSIEEQYIHPPYESISFIITGITEYDNKSENNAYLNVPILDNPLLSNFLSDTDHMDLPFRILNIMVKPDTDMDAMKASLNQFFHLDQSEFKLISELGMVQSSDESYKINTPTIIIALLITFIALSAYSFTNFKSRKNVKKTITVLDSMSYKRSYVTISLFIDFTITTLITLGCSLLMQFGLNQISINFKLAQLIQLNYGMIALICAILSLFSYLFIHPARKSKNF